ncbi:MAG: OsmC family protein [Thermoplasmatota archaeon]
MATETALATPLSPVSVRVVMRHLELVQDKPASSGGKDSGPMASELLLASLLACQHSTFHKVAGKRRLPVEVVALRGAVHFDGAGDIQDMDVQFEIARAVPDEAMKTALRLTESACTISKALRVPVKVGYVVATSSA